MDVRILGCSGGIGGNDPGTTAFLVDGDVLIDAGTGVAVLSPDELSGIRHVFLTHTHMDHIAFLPMLVDANRETLPLRVYGLPEVLEILRAHIFNWSIWPDFTQIPDSAHPSLEMVPVAVGQPVPLGERTITPLPAVHTVPAVGYHLEGPGGSLAFSGDTTVNPAFWTRVNAMANLKVLIMETAFPNHDRKLAQASRHLCPTLLADELAQYQGDGEIFISHLKPEQRGLIMTEIIAAVGGRKTTLLQAGQVFHL